MSADPSASLLEGGEQGSQANASSFNWARRIRSLWSREETTLPRRARSDENTPLLARGNTDDNDDGYESDVSESANASVSEVRPSSGHSFKTKKPKSRRVATILALVVLCLAAIAILGVGFAAPEAMQEYAEQATVFEPTKLSIDSFTADGVNARVQGDFYLDSSRVERKSVRAIGRSLSWMARAVETKTTQVSVSLPEYDVELGTAEIPPIVVSIKEMEKTPIDVVVKITPGDPKGLKQIASDWVEGRLGQLRLKGIADVSLKSGIFPLGSQTITQIFTFREDEVPSMPKYSISKIKVHEVELPDNSTGLSADVSISAFNKYPLSFDVPPLAFEILVPGCSPAAPSILLANASSQTIHIEAKKEVVVNASGTVRQLSDNLLSQCPGSNTSPLDLLLGDYLHGNEAKMYVRGSQNPLPDTPAWIADIMQSVLVAVPFSGSSMKNLIRNFSMEDTHFSMPNPLADPNTPAGQPRISTDILVLANLPEEINFPIAISRVRSNADVYYNGSKFGVLELRRWQKASSKFIEGHGDVPQLLAVEANIRDAPLGITDQDVFTKVIEGVLFGEDVTLDVKAAVDVEVSTALGTFAIRHIPAKGKVPLKPLLGDGFRKNLDPSLGDLEIQETSPTTLHLAAYVNVTNPTNYSADVPYVNVNLLYNGTALANISLEDFHIRPGRNTMLPFRLKWDPLGLSGEEGAAKGKDLISKHVSGWNTSITLSTHSGTFPSTPWLGSALSSFKVTIPTPKMKRPHDPNDPNGDKDGPHFIDDATMHLISSTAEFILLSPFQRTTLYLTHIDAIALYNETDPVGHIIYDLPIEVPPGKTQTPRLPLDWSLGSVGYEAVKEALGGTLKVGAKANVSVRIDQWEQSVFFEGKGIGAHIQL